MVRTRLRWTVTLGLLLALPAAAAAATANVKLSVRNEGGERLAGGLFVFALVDDPTQKMTIGENDAGGYGESVQLPREDAEWKLVQVLVENHLPVRIGVRSEGAGGAVVQQIDGMELDPSVAIPPIRLVAGGSVQIDLTLGERGEVMRRFLEARSKAAAAAAEDEEQPADAGGPYGEALRLYNEGDVDGALPRFREAAEQQPDNLELHVTYAKVLYGAKRFEEFENAARQALRLDPSNRELVMMVYGSARTRGDMRAALEALQSARRLGGGSELLQHLDFVARKLGQTPDAIPAWEAILEIDPKNVEASVALASAYTRMGKTAQADAYVTRVVELAPREAPRLYVELASKLIFPESVPAADLARAIALLRKAIALDSSYAPAYKRLGLALWKQKDYAGTRQAFETYLRLHPDADDRQQIADYLSRLPS